MASPRSAAQGQEATEQSPGPRIVRTAEGLLRRRHGKETLSGMRELQEWGNGVCALTLKLSGPQLRDRQLGRTPQAFTTTAPVSVLIDVTACADPPPDCLLPRAAGLYVVLRWFLCSMWGWAGSRGSGSWVPSHPGPLPPLLGLFYVLCSSCVVSVGVKFTAEARTHCPVQLVGLYHVLFGEPMPIREAKLGSGWGCGAEPRCVERVQPCRQWWHIEGY